MITYEEYINLRVANNEKIASLESLIGEKIPRDLLQKAIESNTAEEFMRPYYCRELQYSLTDISLQKAEKIDGIDVINFNGDKFTMLVSVLGAFSHTDETEWSFQPKENGSKTLATSLITDEFMGHYADKDKDLIILGYTKIPDDSLYLCGPQDLCSIHDNGTYEKRERIMGVNYIPSRQMARQTSSMYNEYAILRRNSKGEKTLPTCIVTFNSITEIDEKTKRYAKKYHLPIVSIEWEKYKNIQRQKLIDFEKKENPTPEELEKYLYGVVAFFEESLCFNLSKQHVPGYVGSEKIKEKITFIESKLKIDKDSKYWPVCKKFIDFQQSTRNDANGRVFVRDIFKDNCQEEELF